MNYDYYGFVYIWYDTVNKRFIIGSHHGSLEDGYTTTTGGKYVKNIFRSRPNTMKRRVLEYNTTVDDYRFTQQLEQKWLDLRPDIATNVRYYNMKNTATGGIDRSVVRTKPAAWRQWKSRHNIQRAARGEHNFNSENCKQWAIQRVNDGSHHFLNSDFNKKPFQLIRNGVVIGTYSSKVEACKVWPAHLIDKLRKNGVWVAAKGPTSRYKGKWLKGDRFEYQDIS